MEEDKYFVYDDAGKKFCECCWEGGKVLLKGKTSEISFDSLSEQVMSPRESRLRRNKKRKL